MNGTVTSECLMIHYKKKTNKKVRDPISLVKKNQNKRTKKPRLRFYRDPNYITVNRIQFEHKPLWLLPG